MKLKWHWILINSARTHKQTNQLICIKKRGQYGSINSRLKWKFLVIYFVKKRFPWIYIQRWDPLNLSGMVIRNLSRIGLLSQPFVFYIILIPSAFTQLQLHGVDFYSRYGERIEDILAVKKDLSRYPMQESRSYSLNSPYDSHTLLLCYYYNFAHQLIATFCNL